jgi:hypothetical protein
MHSDRIWLRYDQASTTRDVVESGNAAPGSSINQHSDELNYRGLIDLRVHNNSHTRVMRYIRESGSPQRGPILDVGCSFGNVLEHLQDPLETLINFHTLLDSDGTIIVTIPNVAHKSVRLMLLKGRWDYDSGILDCTHLHFFTRELLTDLIDNAGYAIERFSTNNLDTISASTTVTPKVADAFANLIRDKEQDVFNSL